MPWRHCDAVITDDVPCPKCGIAKAAWTTEWNVTRTFRVSRKAAAEPAVKLALVDPKGDPVPNEPWELLAPGAPPRAGTLDKYGYVKVPLGERAAVEVVFPDRTAGDFLEEGGDGPARFTVEPDIKHTFQLLARPARVTLVDDRLRPLPDISFEVVTAAGDVLPRTFDAQARATIDLPEPCTLRFKTLARPLAGATLVVPTGLDVRVSTHEAAAGIQVRPGRALRVILLAHHLSARLIDQLGGPVAGVPVRVELPGPDRQVVTLTTDADGVVRHGPTETGVCRLELRLDHETRRVAVPAIDDAQHRVTVRLVRRAPLVSVIVCGDDGLGARKDEKAIVELLARSGLPPATESGTGEAAGTVAALCSDGFSDVLVYYTGHGMQIDTASPEAVLAALARARWRGARATWIIDACGSGSFAAVQASPSAFSYRAELPIVRVYAATDDGTAWGTAGGVFTDRLAKLSHLDELDRRWEEIRAASQWRGTVKWWLRDPFGLDKELHGQRPTSTADVLEKKIRDSFDVSAAAGLRELLGAEGLDWSWGPREAPRIVSRSPLRDRALLALAEGPPDEARPTLLVDGDRLVAEVKRVVDAGGSVLATWGPTLAERVRLLLAERRAGRTRHGRPPWGDADLPLYDFVGITPPITSATYADPTTLSYERLPGVLFARGERTIDPGEPPPAGAEHVGFAATGAPLYRDRAEIEPEDVEQGALGTCYVLASLIAIALSEPQTLRAMLHTEGEGVHLVRLHGVRPDGGDVVLRLDDRFPVVAGSTWLAYAKAVDIGADGQELWPRILEKAWALWHGGYRRVEGGDPSRALAILTGRPVVTHWLAGLPEERIQQLLDDALERRAPTVVWTPPRKVSEAFLLDHPGDMNLFEEWKVMGLPEIAQHALTLVGKEPGSRYQLRNPWGGRSALPRALTPAQFRKYFEAIGVCPR